MHQWISLWLLREPKIPVTGPVAKEGVLRETKDKRGMRLHFKIYKECLPIGRLLKGQRLKEISFLHIIEEELDIIKQRSRKLMHWADNSVLRVGVAWTPVFLLNSQDCSLLSMRHFYCSNVNEMSLYKHWTVAHSSRVLNSYNWNTCLPSRWLIVGRFALG